MNFWNVEIECTNDSAEIPEDLRGQLKGSDIEWRKGVINMDHVNACYQDQTHQHTLVDFNDGTCIMVKDNISRFIIE